MCVVCVMCVLCVWVCVSVCVRVGVCVCSVCLQMFRSVQMPRAMLRSVLKLVHRGAEQCTTAQISVCGCVSVSVSVSVCVCVGVWVRVCVSVCLCVCVVCVLCVCVACVCVLGVCVCCVCGANQILKVFAVLLKRTRKSHASEQSSSTWTDKSARRSLGIYNAITQQTGQRHWAAPQGSTTGQH